MPTTYTFNQTMAIACAFAGSTWALTAHAAAIMLGISAPIYVIFILISWILMPLYIRLVRQAFIVGIFLTAIGLAYLLVTPSLFGTAPWYNFKRGLYDFTYVVFYIIGIALIHFAYKSYKELLTKAQ